MPKKIDKNKIKVEEGDTLWGLAKKYLGSGSRWKELGQQIGITTPEQAKQLQIGQTLNIAPEPSKEPETPITDKTPTQTIPSSKQGQTDVSGAETGDETETAPNIIAPEDLTKQQKDFIKMMGFDPTQPLTPIQFEDIIGRGTSYNDSLKFFQQQMGRLPATPKEKNLVKQLAGIETAQTEEDETTAPTGMLGGQTGAMNVLQNAIRKKTGAQDIQLGQSELFKQAGLGDFETLSQSLSTRASEIEQDRVLFQNTVKTMANALSEERQNAQTNLDTLISAGALDLDDNTLRTLSNASGMPFEALKALQSTQQASEQVINSYARGIEKGNINLSSVPSSYRNKVASKVNWDNIEKGRSWSSLPNSYREWSLAGGKEGTGMDYAQHLEEEDEKSVDYKFGPNDIERLISVDLTLPEIQKIQSDINAGLSVGAVTSSERGLTSEQSKTLRDIFEGVTPTQARKAEEEAKSSRKKIKADAKRLKSEDASRDEAENRIRAAISNNGKKEIPSSIDEDIKEIMVEVYGKKEETWSKPSTWTWF